MARWSAGSSPAGRVAMCGVEAVVAEQFAGAEGGGAAGRVGVVGDDRVDVVVLAPGGELGGVLLV